jgi:hypothetical protein
MASSRTNDNNLDEEDWAFVDIHGAVLVSTIHFRVSYKSMGRTFGEIFTFSVK